MTRNTSNRFDPLPESLAGAKPATAYTIKKNRDVLAQLPFEDRQAFEDARRGFCCKYHAGDDHAAFGWQENLRPIQPFISF